MLAYTAVDGLRAISRDFDLDWQPTVSGELANARRESRSALRGERRIVGVLAFLLPFGMGWLR